MNTSKLFSSMPLQITLIAIAMLIISSCIKSNNDTTQLHYSHAQNKKVNVPIDPQDKNNNRHILINLPDAIFNNFFVGLNSSELLVDDAEQIIIAELRLRNSETKIKFKIDKATQEITDEETSQKVDNVYLSDIKRNTKLSVLLIVLNATRPTTDIELSDNFYFPNHSQSLRACRRTIVSIQDRRSSAISTVEAITIGFLRNHPDCRRRFGVDSGCLWGDYLCIATQEIECTGGGCNVPMGTL